MGDEPTVSVEETKKVDTETVETFGEVEHTQEEEQNEDEFVDMFTGLSKELTDLKFYSDQVRVNTILYQGVTLLLKKMSHIEQLLSVLDPTVGVPNEKH